MLAGTVITVIGSVAVAGLTHYMARKKEIEAEWRKQKLQHYQNLLTAISKMAATLPPEKSPPSSEEAIEAETSFADAYNTLVLIAPHTVIEATQSFASNSQPDALTPLVRELRKDLDIPDAELPQTFRHLLYGGFAHVKRTGVA